MPGGSSSRCGGCQCCVLFPTQACMGFPSWPVTPPVLTGHTKWRSQIQPCVPWWSLSGYITWSSKWRPCYFFSYPCSPLVFYTRLLGCSSNRRGCTKRWKQSQAPGGTASAASALNNKRPDDGRSPKCYVCFSWFVTFSSEGFESALFYIFLFLCAWDMIHSMFALGETGANWKITQIDVGVDILIGRTKGCIYQISFSKLRHNSFYTFLPGYPN